MTEIKEKYYNKNYYYFTNDLKNNNNVIDNNKTHKNYLCITLHYLANAVFTEWNDLCNLVTEELPPPADTSELEESIQKLKFIYLKSANEKETYKAIRAIKNNILDQL